MTYSQIRHDGGFFCTMFIVSGPRIANTTLVPSGEASMSFTSYEAFAVTRAVMLVSVALGEALSRL